MKMKTLPIKHPDHVRLEKSLKKWLEVTGYAPMSVYNIPNSVREFFHYLEHNKLALDQLEARDINNYFFYLRQRRKQLRSGALSTSYLHKHLQSIKLLSRYLRETGQPSFEVDASLPQQKSKIPEILTREEIKRLYEACDCSPMGLRDRAMLSVFYGCGLRRSEGVSLDTTDFLHHKNLLYVRKAKNNRERYVPLTQETRQDIQNYLDYGRDVMIKTIGEQAFFLSERGNRITGQSFMLRLRKLTAKAEITKPAGLHTLRHSIATHLLENGMKLINISRFLGHTSLESTQIYTHLSAEVLMQADIINAS
jgi:integrase/recombinase XerD